MPEPARCPEVVVVTPAAGGHGGISAVIELYETLGIVDALNIRIVNTFSNHAWRKPLVLARALMELIGTMLTKPARVVHINTAADNSFRRKTLFWAIAKLFGRKVVWQIHSGEFTAFAQQHGWAARVLTWSDSIAVLSSAARNELVRLMPRSAERIVVIPNPAPNAASLDLAKQSEPLRTALYLGRLTEKKGIGELLHAWRKVIEILPGAELTVGGSGETERYRQLAQELGVDPFVHFVGWIDGAEKASFLKRSQVLLLPSHFEAMPVCILEAFAWGCVVVATPVGAIPEMLGDRQRGLLHPVGDAAALAAAITSLESSATRIAFAQSARVYLEENYSAEVVREKLRSWYADVAGAS